MANDCSIRNYEDKDQCKAYFANYRACMEFWVSQNDMHRFVKLYFKQSLLM